MFFLSLPLRRPVQPLLPGPDRSPPPAAAKAAAAAIQQVRSAYFLERRCLL